MTNNVFSIDEQTFNTLYADLHGKYEFYANRPPADISGAEFERTCLRSKLWRMNHLYTVINKDGAPVPFRMNASQHVVYAASRQHPRLIILKSRQQGISTFWLISFIDDALFCPYLTLGLMAQGADEASTLLERAKFTWDNLSESVKNFLGVKLVKDNTKEFSFSNSSTMFIRTSFRSATLQRLHVSEMGKIANNYPKRAKETKTGSLQALGRGNTGVIESTAEGRNMFKDMWDLAVLTEQSGQLSPKDFKPVFLSWLQDPDCRMSVPQNIPPEAQEYFNKLAKSGVTLDDEQKNFWVAQYRELGGDIYQEYPATPEEAFTASRDGTYYSRLFSEEVVRKGRVVRDLYDPNLPVEAWFDLGVDDYTVVILLQMYRGEYRIIDEYWNNGYALSHYIDEVEAMNYNVRTYRMPHDISVRELGAANQHGLAKSRLQILQEYFKSKHMTASVQAVAKGSLIDGIENVRRMIPRMKIDPRCTYIIDCLHNYSKEWDDKLQTWKKTPLHDEYSHGADVLRQIASSASESEESSASRLAPSRRERAPSGFAI